MMRTEPGWGDQGETKGWCNDQGGASVQLSGWSQGVMIRVEPGGGDQGGARGWCHDQGGASVQ